MAEYLGLAVDIGAYFLFSHLETRLKGNFYDVRDNVPTFRSLEALKGALRASETGDIPYARLDGRVEPVGQPLYTEKDGETAVFRITENCRVRRDRESPEETSRWSTSVERKGSSTVEHVPFCLALSKDAGVYANPEKILNLKRFGKTVSFVDFEEIGNSIRREARIFAKKFYPDDECLTDYEISKLTTRAGVQTEEYTMKTGSAVSVVGRVSWKSHPSAAADDHDNSETPDVVVGNNKRQIVVGAPTDANRLILTQDVDALLLDMEDEAHRYNVGRRAAILVGVVLFYVAWDRFRRDFAEWRKRIKR